MNFEYTFPKRKFSNKSVFNKMQVFFKNGDFLEIRKNEIIVVNLEFYDKLIRVGKESYPVIKGGFIKLRLQDGKAKQESRFLYNPKEYNKNRKGYIENRLTANGEIRNIRIYNQNNFHEDMYGDIYATLEGEYLFIKFKENELYGGFENENHTISLGTVSKKIVEKIDLDFENCESFEIFQSEIIDMNLNFKKELYWNASGYIRSVESGFIRLKLDPEITWRHTDLAIQWEGKKIKGINALAKALCWRKKGKSEINICHLYITYDHAGYGSVFEEVVEVPEFEDGSAASIYPKFDDYDDFDKYYRDHYDEDKENEYDDFYYSGYAEMQDDGSILIVFCKKI